SVQGVVGKPARLGSVERLPCRPAVGVAGGGRIRPQTRLRQMEMNAGGALDRQSPAKFLDRLLRLAQLEENHAARIEQAGVRTRIFEGAVNQFETLARLLLMEGSQPGEIIQDDGIALAAVL